MPQRKKGNIALVDSIPVNIAHKLQRNRNLAFTDTDKNKDGTYVHLPHVVLKEFV